ncbi:MAG: lipase family protein [Candidatus Nanopelagicales bacterium]
MTAGRIVLIAFLAIVLALGVVGVANVLSSRAQADALQTSLNPFYTPPDSLPTDPGAVIRVEPLTFDDTTFSIEGGSAYRMLYVSQRPDGTPAASGAMIFVPDSPAPPEGRPVVAWAHGTVGMGDACAPSRSPKGTDDLGDSLAEMVQQGWVVVATDYVGLGTPGVELYIVAQAEANDVVNSVRAARNWEPAQAGKTYAVFGHSQGGHSSLWTGHLGPQIAPELDLVGVAAAAPAAELELIMGAQWDGVVGWAIGPEATVAWRAIDPALPLEGVLTQTGIDNTQSLADACIIWAALQGQVRSNFGGQYFEINPAQSAPWATIVQEQTPPPLPADMPVFVAQGTTDEVVLAWPNAVLQETWCAAGSNLTMLWMGDIGHIAAAKTSGPQVVSWIADRFAGKPATPACDGPIPVAIP